MNSNNKTVTNNITPIIKSIEQELSLYVGPMAEFICEEYIEDAGLPSSISSLEAFVNSIALEIDDKNDSEQFKHDASKNING